MADQETTKPEQNPADGADQKTGSGQVAETQTAKSQTEASQSERSYSQTDLDKLVSRARAEEKRRYEQQLKDAQLSESERANKRIADLEREIRNRDAKETIIEASRKAGASNAVAVHAIIQSMIEFDDKGSITNLKDAIDHARETAPELFPKRPGSANGGDGRSANVSQSMNDIIRRASGRL